MSQVVQHVTSGQALPIPEDAPPDLKALMQATLAHNPDDRCAEAAAPQSNDWASYVIRHLSMAQLMCVLLINR